MFCVHIVSTLEGDRFRICVKISLQIKEYGEWLNRYR